jgi:transcription factor E
MIQKLLKEVISIVVGKQAEEIAELLNNKKHVNEFLIAKKLEITINQTRNILYKISDHGLVSSIRKKDKRKGWYTYFWKIEVLKSLEFLKKFLIKKIDEINHQIKSRETKMFYVCETCNIEVSEENALLNNFTCNECGKIFTVKDNTRVLREFNRNLDKLNKELEEVEVEIKIESEKLDKKKTLFLKREKLKKLANRKSAKKKVVKKKVVKKKIVKKKIVKKKITKKKPIKKKIIKKKILNVKAKKKIVKKKKVVKKKK